MAIAELKTHSGWEEKTRESPVVRKVVVVVVDVVRLEMSFEYDGGGVDGDTCIVVVVGGGVAGREGRTGGRDGEGVSLVDCC